MRINEYNNLEQFIYEYNLRIDGNLLNIPLFLADKVDKLMRMVLD